MANNEIVVWRKKSETKDLPPLNYVLIYKLTLPALQHSTIDDLTRLGTGFEDDSLVTGLRGRVLCERREMRWIVRWDWSPTLGIHINYWYDIPSKRESQSFAFCVDRRPPSGQATYPPNHFYSILRMVTQDAEYDHKYHNGLGTQQLGYRQACGRRLRDKWVTIFSETQEKKSRWLRW